MQAADRGEAFDVETGLPDSMVREVSSVTWYQHACAFADVRWQKVAAKGRISLVEGLVAVTPVLVTSHRGAPDAEILRQAMRRWAFNPPRRSSPMPAEIEKALRWLDRSSVPVSALQGARTVSQALDACGRKLDGSAAAPEYYRRRRRILYSALKYAVREGHLSANPLDGTNEPEWKTPEVSSAVDRRRVASPAQMEELLAAIETVGRTQGPRLKALFGCMYYGMLRPSEATSLLLDECKLPKQGWGLLEFSEISSAAGRDWTDDGKVHAASTPKGGPRNAIRRTPIPPVLVRMIVDHVQAYGTAPDGRLFQTCRGGIYSLSTLWRVLQEARQRVLNPAQLKSPLIHKPYDCRHGGVSWRLNAGVPAPLVAEWACRHSRGPPPHLRSLHRRRRRPMVRPDGGRARASLIWPVRWQYPACGVIERGEGWDNG